MAGEENDRVREELLRLQIRLSEIEANNEINSASLTSLLISLGMGALIQFLLIIEFSSENLTFTQR